MFSNHGASIYQNTFMHTISSSNGHNTPVRVARPLSTSSHIMECPQADCIAFALNGVCHKNFCRYRHLPYSSFSRDCRYWVGSGGTRCANQGMYSHNSNLHDLRLFQVLLTVQKKKVTRALSDTKARIGNVLEAVYRSNSGKLMLRRVFCKRFIPASP